ncbi:MAG: hypothetical protein KTR20_14180 [Cellvibrionaceae bacterium]|nr:hypothetical protein [Cellvibrionaceae bacterium]
MRYCNDLPLTLHLSVKEKALVLKVYDYGVDALNLNELRLLDSIFKKLTKAIYP